jgi:hypothetical protein
MTRILVESFLAPPKLRSSKGLAQDDSEFGSSRVHAKCEQAPAQLVFHLTKGHVLDAPSEKLQLASQRPKLNRLDLK